MRNTFFWGVPTKRIIVIAFRGSILACPRQGNYHVYLCFDRVAPLAIRVGLATNQAPNRDVTERADGQVLGTCNDFSRRLGFRAWI